MSATEDPARSMIRYYPDRAQREGKPGETTVRCLVTGEGRLVNCNVLKESPAGFGFAEASLNLATIFRLKPKTKDGVPVAGATYIFNIHWRLPRDATPPAPLEIGLGTAHVPSVSYVRDLDKAMRRFYPDRALQLGKAGEARIRCRVTAIGALVGCFVLKEDPEALGFGEASLNLAPIYRLQPRTQDGMAVSQAFYTFDVVWTPPAANRPSPTAPLH